MVCTLASGTPTASACGFESTFQAGFAASGKSRVRGLIAFPLRAEHEDEEVISARLELYVGATTSASGAAIGVYRVSTPWTDAATWDTSNGSTSWKAVGGDFAEGGGNEAVNSSVGTKTGWAYWYPTRLVQEWYNGSDAPTGQGQPDLGLLIKDVEEGKTDNVVTFDGRSEVERYPGLWVESARRGVGESSRYTQLTTPLSSSTSLSVNPASGNLLVHSNDFSIPDAGFEFDSSRNWNSLQPGAPGYGEGWVDGNAVFIQPFSGSSAVAFTDSSDHTFVFMREGAGYITPPGIDATMCVVGSPAPCPETLPSGTSYQLIYDQTGERIDFPGSKQFDFPINVVNKSGQTLTAGYRGEIEEPISWTDAEGTKITYAYGRCGYSKITDEGTKQSATYTENEEFGACKLVRYTSMSGQETSYSYGQALESLMLAQVTEPDGEVVKLSYDEHGRVTKVQRLASAGAKPSTTTYAYYGFGEAPAPCVAKEKGTRVSGPAKEGETPTEALYCANVFDEAHRPAPVNTAAPTISGAAVEGQTLVASTGSWEGVTPISYAFQWQDCNAEGKRCEDIEAATGSSYTLEAADVGETVRVRVSATNAGGATQAFSAATGTVSVGAPSELEAPSIQGTPDVGETLSADGGTWEGGEVQLSYQWQSCNESGGECKDIQGATQEELTLKEADQGRTLRVQVGASNALASVSDHSAASVPVGAASLIFSSLGPVLSGEAQVGKTLTANPGSWVGQAAIGYAYQWERCEADGSGCATIAGATASTYTLAEADAGKTVRVRVQAGETEGAESTRKETSALTDTVAATGAPVAEEAPRLAGPPIEGQQLSGSDVAFSGEGLSYAVQWERCNASGESCTAIEGATGDSYTLGSADVGATVRLAVKATSSGGSTTALSRASAVIAAQSPADVSAPSVSGADHEGQTLTASAGIWTGRGTISFSYQWQRCNESGAECATIEGASESTYRAGSADVGKTLKVAVEAKRGSEATSATSAPTGKIASEGTAPVGLSQSTLEGGATAGQTLTADPGEWSGTQPISFAYQWQKCSAQGGECANIEGATSQSYTLGEGDIAATVKVLVTASNATGKTESAGSQPSEAIDAAGPPANTDRPTIEGSPQEGTRLAANIGGWLGTRPLSYAFQWKRCNTAGAECAAIEGATGVAYTPAAADVGHTLRVEVTAINSTGDVGAESAASGVIAAAGQASNTEAIKAVQANAPSLIASSTEASLENQAIAPQIEDAGEELAAASTLTSSTISKDTAGEFAVDSADGQLAFEPQGSSLRAATLPSIVNGSAAIYAGAYPHTDMILRPQPLGASTQFYLTSKEAPGSFSWEVRLGLDQQLVKLENGSVAVVETSSEAFSEPGVGEETPETHEAAPESTGAGKEGISAQEAEAKAEEEPESKEEALPKAPSENTKAVEAKEGELQPQQTKATYQAGNAAISYAEEKTAGKTLLVIEAPKAVDATGAAVESSLSVEGDTITLTVADPPSYPVTAKTNVVGHTDKHIEGLTHGYTYGLADENTTPFENFDPKLRDGNGPIPKHGMQIARKETPYNTARPKTSIKGYNPPPANAKEFVNLEKWLQAVKSAKLTPFITLSALLSKSKNAGFCVGAKELGSKCKAPSAKVYEADFKALLVEMHEARQHEKEAKVEVIPLVRLWGAWNEPSNGAGAEAKEKHDPLYDHPERAARFWEIANHVLHSWAPKHLSEYKNCRHCLVVAGEFAGVTGTSIAKYVTQYIQTIVNHNRRHEWPKPAAWSLHDYGDLIKHWQPPHSNPELRAMASILEHHSLGHPHLWLSEQAVLLSAGNEMEGHPKHQREAAVDFSQLAKDAKRYVELVDYYEYRGPSAAEIARAKEHKEVAFDSGLLYGEGVKGHENAPYDWRPAYCVLVLGLKSNSCPPRAESRAAVAASVKAHSGTVTLTVDPQGAPTKYWVQYGTSTEYGHTTTTTPVANPEGKQSEAVALSGLEECTTYHYQAEAENEASEGKPSVGGDQTFRTRCKATAVAGAWSHDCALLADGGVECWGNNSVGQLGDGTTTGSDTPVPVSGISKATAIAAGRTGSCAVISGGSVECWGENGDPPAGAQLASPLLGEAVEAVEARPSPTTLSPSVAVKPGTVTDSHTPEPVSGIENATAVTVGIQFECALLSTGHIDCWGDNESGQLGDGTTESSSTPVAVSGISSAVAITAGREYACALLSAGGVECWGYPPNSTSIETTPHPVSGISSGSAIADAGFAHICVVISSGEDYCWGYNETGQLGDGSYEYSYTPVEVQGLSAAATRPGGSVVSSCAL
ncbi:MAG: DNRLRE domain-containing protein, partial [Solirubrobacteraceae bacterium]